MKKIFFQTAIIIVSAFVIYLTRPLTVLYELGRWIILPVLGFITAYMCTRKGINPYLSWISPPVSMTIAAYTAQGGYLPAFGAVLMTAFFSIAGAATADTKNRYKQKKHK